VNGGVIELVKISTFIVGLIVASLLVGVFMLFMSDVATNYSVQHDEQELAVYNQLNNMSYQAQKIYEQTNDIKEKTGLLDVVGGYFSSAYQALKLTLQSFNVFSVMTNAAVDDAGLGATGNLFKVAIISIMLVTLVIGVIITAIMKWGL
jgi:hypothetical protein